MVATLGSDPEVFITDKHGRLKSIIGLLGGTKEQPRWIDDFGEFKVQEDNVAAEYNIPASFTRERFIQHILWPQKVISKIIGTDKYELSKLASASFPQEELTDPKAQEFGCDPDFNAWTGQINEKPVCDDPTFRTAGGHVHIGLDNKDPWNIIKTIRNMDKYVGVWSVLIDKDDNRRKLYGKAGCFRPQPHGCEYRTLSNFWIFDPALIGEVWDRTQAAVGHDELIADNSGEAAMIQHIINKGDKVSAQAYLKSQRLL
jgi:hypothetical protein